MDLFLNQYLPIRKRKLSNDLQLRFLHRLDRLLTNGYPLLESLEVCKWDMQLELPAEQIILTLKNGQAIDQAFEQAGFHQTITTYLYFVKANGDLLGSIKKCIEMYEHRISTAKRFQQVIRYPVILFIIFSVLLYFINQYVLPSFTDLFQSSAQASATISISMAIIDILSTLLLIVTFLLSVFLLIWHFTKHKVPIRKQMKLFEAIPIYRTIVQLQTSFFFATHFSTLLKTGMPYKEILTHMANQQKLPIIAYYSTQMIEELNQGIHITNLLSHFTFLDKQLTAIFHKHMDASALEKDLSMYAQILMEDIERKTVRIITYLQPIIFIVLASFVIFIYVTLMWPMFDLIQTI